MKSMAEEIIQMFLIRIELELNLFIIKEIYEKGGKDVCKREG